MGFIQNENGFLFTRYLSTSKQLSYATTSYLVNAFGLSREVAESLPMKINIKNPDKADAAISQVRGYGLTDAHISEFVRKHPRLLFANPDKTLFPKLEFLLSIGALSSDLRKMVFGRTCLWTRSLQHFLIPCYNVLKSVLVSNEKVVFALKRLSDFNTCGLPKNLAINISILRDLGVPQSAISYLVFFRPYLMGKDSVKFKNDVFKAIEIGVEPFKHSTFVQAMEVISELAPATWEQKIEIYRTWGLSEGEIRSAIKRYPLCVRFSRKKIMNTMNFLVNNMGWLPADVVRVPSVMGYSLEKRIIPRCSVVRVLRLKGMVKGATSLSSVLSSPERVFLNQFVIKHQEEVPQLLDIFRGEMNITELGLGFENKTAAVF